MFIIREVYRMIAVVTIFLFVIATMIAIVFFVPSIKIGHFSLSIYWMIPFLGAVVFLIFGFLSPSEVISGLTAAGEVNPIKILVLFLSMTFMSVYLDELGFFRMLAMFVLKKARNNQVSLFIMLYIVVSVLTVFTSNDIIILTFTPFICHFAKASGINPIPYLVSEFIAANTWSMALIIGNPTNIYLISGTDITFWEYVRIMIFPTIVAGLVSFLMLFLIFSKNLKESLTPVCTDQDKTDKIGILIGLIHLCGCIITLSISSFVNLPMWIITFGFFCSLVICTAIVSVFRKTKPYVIVSSLKRVPWTLIPFVISMFILVLALQKYEITTLMLRWLNVSDSLTSEIGLFGISSFVMANLINNIPMSVLYSSLISELSSTSIYVPALFSAVIGSNLGAFFTPIGALAGIMWMSQLKEHNVRFSFGAFIRYGASIAIPTVLATLAAVSICF